MQIDSEDGEGPVMVHDVGDFSVDEFFYIVQLGAEAAYEAEIKMIGIRTVNKESMK